jgi:small subunit ribosomal protein S16
MHRFIDPIEQVGTYDPLVNAHGEKLVSLNIERINYYLAQGIKVDTSVAQLLGNLPS